MDNNLKVNEQGYCPHCNLDLDGEYIYETFLKFYKDPVKASEVSKLFGATSTKGKWGKAVYIQSYSEDYFRKWKYWKCPDCGGEWGSVPDEPTTD